MRNGLYSSDQSENITLLENALNVSNGEGPIDPEKVYYSITNNLTNVTNSNANKQVLKNSSYVANLTADVEYSIDSVSVTMGGTDITSTAYSDGVITINSVTGDIVIIANAIVSSSSEGLITDGLLAYVDCRTCKYDNAGSGGKTVIYPIQGEGCFFAWQTNGVATQDNYGIHFANGRLHAYDKNGGTTATDLGTQLTVVSLTHGHVGNIGFSWNNITGWEFGPSYINTSGSTVKLNNSSHNRDNYKDYNFQVYRINGTTLTQIMDTSSQIIDGSTIDDFASWNANAGIPVVNATGDGVYATATAIYNRALSDVEIEEMRAFFKTLEVTE